MMTFVFAVLIVGAVIGIFWGTAAVALRQSRQTVTMEETGPDRLADHAAHLRMW